MEQTERIKYYENLLNKGERIVENFYKALDEVNNFKESYQELSDYYESEERKKDVFDDENGKLPDDILTGVLGEDYCYDFLVSYEGILNITKNK